MGSRYGIDSKALVIPTRGKKVSHPLQTAQRAGAGLHSKFEHSLSYLDRAATIDRVHLRRFCEFVTEVLYYVAMLMHDRIVGLPYKHIVQLWVERISVQPGDIAFVIGCIELNLAVAWNGGDFRSRLCAGHTDFKRTRSNFDGKRFAFLTVHADVVIHSDVAHQGSLGVVRAGSEVVDVIENRLFADGGLIEED